METTNLYFAIRDARGISSSQKAVLFALASRCGLGKNKAWPSVPLLAADSGLSVRGTQKVFLQLEAMGWLKIKPVSCGNNNSANEYTITPVKSSEPSSPPGEPSSPPPGEPRSCEVENIPKVEKEIEKPKLTTRPRHKGKNNHHPFPLASWMLDIGCSGVEVAAKFRDRKTGVEKKGVQQIDPEKADAANRAGNCIFIRPSQDKQLCILLDDLDAEAVKDVANRWRSASVETSEGNFQVWIATSRKMTVEERRQVQRIVGAGYGADKGSVSGEHYGRCPGFMNRKPERRGFVSRLIHADDSGKLLDVDAVLRQVFSLQPRYRRQPTWTMPTFPRKYKSRIRSGGDTSESGREWGWVMGSIEHGMHPTEVESRLIDHAEARRGQDSSRYAARTVREALKKVGARADDYSSASSGGRT